MSISEDAPAEESRAAPRFGPPTTANPLWRAVVLCGVSFVLSCLLWITAGIGNPEAPGNQWLNRHGVTLVLVTGIASIAAAVAAMAVDQAQTSRLLVDEEESPPESDSDRDGTLT